MWGKTVLVLRIAATVWAAIVGLGAILQISQVLPELPKLEPWVWGVSLGIIAVDNVGTLFVRKRRAEREKREAKIQSTLQAALRHIVGDRTLRLEDLGANVFLASGWRWRRQESGSVRLSRAAHFRPIGYPQQSGISWTTAKGAVGECWRKRSVFHCNWHAIAARYDGELTAGAYAKIPATTKQGFSLTEFNRILRKYSEVLAEPIWHPGKEGVLIGVLTIDRVFQDGVSEFSALLGKRPVKETAGLAAKSIAAILKSRDEQS